MNPEPPSDKIARKRFFARERVRRHRQKEWVREREKERHREYAKRPEVLERKRNAKRLKLQSKENREKNQEYQRNRYANGGREKMREYFSQPEVRERIRKYENRRRKNEPNVKLAYLLRMRLYAAFKGRVKCGSSVKLLGCSINEARRYIEAQFQSGMSWDNHGLWHIDHKRPLASFDLTDPDQFAQSCHYTNLQPLWAAINFSKGARLNYSDTTCHASCNT